MDAREYGHINTCVSRLGYNLADARVTDVCRCRWCWRTQHEFDVLNSIEYVYMCITIYAQLL